MNEWRLNHEEAYYDKCSNPHFKASHVCQIVIVLYLSLSLPAGADKYVIANSAYLCEL